MNACEKNANTYQLSRKRKNRKQTVSATNKMWTNTG